MVFKKTSTFFRKDTQDYPIDKELATINKEQLTLQ